MKKVIGFPIQPLYNSTMATTKTKKPAKKATKKAAPSDKKPVGRPSKKGDIDLQQLYRMAAAGLTDAQMAQVLGISKASLNNYKKDPSLWDALEKGKKISDSRVVRSLFERATGYEHDAEEIKVIGTEVVRVPVIKHYPPDPTAMIFWLKNRKPEEWRDKHEFTGEDGGPLVVIRDASSKEK